MTNAATYMTSQSQKTRTGRRSFIGASLGLVAVFVAIMSSIVGIVSIDTNKKAEAFDITQWIMCSVLPDPSKMLYQFSQTSDLEFMTRSKSVISSGVTKIDGTLNSLIAASGDSFKEVNRDIVGYPLDPTGVEQPLTEEEYLERYNKGTYVNPFDRFGFAGLKFTGYMGEWKYYAVDACSNNGEPSDPKAGMFYEERLEPRSVWEDRGGSEDPRTKQSNKMLIGQFGTSVANTVANWIFNVTKFIVALTLSFINFSFSDISEVMGLTELVGGDGGIFQSLFSGIFMPLIFMAFALTGGYMFYAGIVKRQYRNAVGSLIRSLVLFLVAMIVAALPTLFISLPNNVAVVAQSLILTSMNSTITGGDQICATDIGQTKSKIVTTDDDEEDVNVLTQASKNIRSVVGCQYWQAFALKPWSEGQFGTDWNNLWANGKTADWAEGGTELGNTNDAMVGEAEVPLGGGKVINNWAIYQISTQTDVHSPTGHPGERPRYTTGVANDWWRIVDALSNYEEETITQTVGGTETSHQAPVKSNVSPYWDSWVGNNSGQKLGAASTSVLVAVIGVAAPLAFAGLSIIYTFGLTILMAFAPLMLLMGCWAPRGWEMFKGWGELVLNTTMKRIAMGLLLTVSILLISSIIKMSEEMAWWQVIVGIALISILLIRTRKNVVDAIASFRFASSNLGATASSVSDRLRRATVGTTKSTAKLAGGATIGGLSSAASGGSFTRGVFAGAKSEAKNIAYRNSGLREVITAYEADQSDNGGDILKKNTHCSNCSKPLDYEDEQYGTGVFHGGRDANGNLICNECMLDGVVPDAQEVTFHRTTAKERANKKREQDVNQLKIYEAYKKKFSKTSIFNKNPAKERTGRIISGLDKKGNVVSHGQRENELKNLLKGVQHEIQDHRDSVTKNSGASGSVTPEIPEDILPYVDADVIAQAWEEEKYDYIRMTYIAAYVAWFNDETQTHFTQSLDEVLQYITTSVPDNPPDKGTNP